MFHSMTDGAHIPQKATVRLRVARVIEETKDARSIVFAVPPELGDAFRYRAGQFLTLFVPVGGVTLKRCYSLASAPGVDAEHKVTVKRVDGGRVSNVLVGGLREGDHVEVEPPAGRFVLAEGTAPIALFGGGSGITPLISIMKAALATSDRKVSLFYANRDAASVIFQRELDELAARYPDRLSIRHWLDDRDGRVSVEAIVPGPEGAHHYLCGPAPFMDAVESQLGRLGVPSSHVHVERFVSPADPVPAGAGAHSSGGDVPARVGVEHESINTEVPYAEGQTLLEAALAAGIDAPYSCRDGFCGCCAALLLEGKVTMAADDALTPEAKKKGLILACQARPTTKACRIRFVEY